MQTMSLLSCHVSTAGFQCSIQSESEPVFGEIQCLLESEDPKVGSTLPCFSMLLGHKTYCCQLNKLLSCVNSLPVTWPHSDIPAHALCIHTFIACQKKCDIVNTPIHPSLLSYNYSFCEPWRTRSFQSRHCSSKQPFMSIADLYTGQWACAIITIYSSLHNLVNVTFTLVTLYQAVCILYKKLEYVNMSYQSNQVGISQKVYQYLHYLHGCVKHFDMNYF